MGFVPFATAQAHRSPVSVDLVADWRRPFSVRMYDRSELAAATPGVRISAMLDFRFQQPHPPDWIRAANHCGEIAIVVGPDPVTLDSLFDFFEGAWILRVKTDVADREDDVASELHQWLNGLPL